MLASCWSLLAPFWSPGGEFVPQGGVWRGQGPKCMSFWILFGSSLGQFGASGATFQVKEMMTFQMPCCLGGYLALFATAASCPGCGAQYFSTSTADGTLAMTSTADGEAPPRHAQHPPPMGPTSTAEGFIHRRWAFGGYFGLGHPPPMGDYPHIHRRWEHIHRRWAHTPPMGKRPASGSLEP